MRVVVLARSQEQAAPVVSVFASRWGARSSRDFAIITPGSMTLDGLLPDRVVWCDGWDGESQPHYLRVLRWRDTLAAKRENVEHIRWPSPAPAVPHEPR